jgi:hypothetical protein
LKARDHAVKRQRQDGRHRKPQFAHSIKLSVLFESRDHMVLKFAYTKRSGGIAGNFKPALVWEGTRQRVVLYVQSANCIEYLYQGFRI